MVWDGGNLDCMQWKEETFDDTVCIRKFTMAQKIDQKYCKPEEEVKLPPEYEEYSSIFEKKLVNVSPRGDIGIMQSNCMMILFQRKDESIHSC